MRIAYFLLPVTHSRGWRFDPAHQEVRGRCLRTFGGFTASDCAGAWKDDTGLTHYDTSIRYDIAADWTPARLSEFRCIVEDAGLLAHQMAMFVVWPDGEAECIPCRPCLPAAGLEPVAEGKAES